MLTIGSIGLHELGWVGGFTFGGVALDIAVTSGVLSQVVTLFIGVLFAGLLYRLASLVESAFFESINRKASDGCGCFSVEVPKQTLERDEFAVMLIMGKNDVTLFISLQLFLRAVSICSRSYTVGFVFSTPCWLGLS